jgi:hypothetical protein
MRIIKWIVGAAALAGLAAALVMWWQHSRGVEAELLAEAPYRILKQHEPAEYARILTAWRELQAGKRSQAAFIREANTRFSEVATRRLGTASQESVRALMNDTLRTVKKLHARSPESCFRYFYPNVAGAPDVSEVLDAQAQRHTLETMGDVVRSSAEGPVARPEQKEIEQPLAEIINATYEQFGTDAQMVAHPDDPRIDRGKVCVITTTLYERIMALPPDVGTKLLRYMAPTS